MKNFNKIMFGVFLIIGLLSSYSLFADCKHNTDNKGHQTAINGSKSYICKETQKSIRDEYYNMGNYYYASDDQNGPCQYCGCLTDDHTQ